MNTFQECCWWLAFIVISIIAQALVPGLDALVVGVLLNSCVKLFQIRF